jgi:hypothetical protein
VEILMLDFHFPTGFIIAAVEMWDISAAEYRRPESFTFQGLVPAPVSQSGQIMR